MSWHTFSLQRGKIHPKASGNTLLNGPHNKKQGITYAKSVKVFWDQAIFSQELSPRKLAKIKIEVASYNPMGFIIIIIIIIIRVKMLKP